MPRVRESGVIRVREWVLKNLGLGEAAKRGVGSEEKQIPDMSFFSVNKSPAGSQFLPSGLLIQWGSADAGAGGIGGGGNVVNFRVAFPNACAQVFATYDNGSTTIPAAAAGNLTATNFRLRCSAGSGAYNFRWLAIGY
ncbi:gp53-like domain-containing protein [Siccibacter colletis]|uniref:gp53-like domain-containing protein n=1 Tax=Siccibacter colletis TaxID=1505757 RepID=UPI0038735788